MAEILDLEPAARRIGDLVAHVDEARLESSTPCGAASVADVLDHINGLAQAFAAAAAKDLGASTSTPPPPDGSNLAPSWRSDIPPRFTTLAAAWTDPAAWEGMTQVGGVTLPGEIAGRVALNELVLHAWDLARGAGLPYQQDEVALRNCLESLTMLYPADDLDRRKGIFEPPVPVPEDAPLVDKVVAFSGRDPGWRPVS
jgi:uncharacterized protein (TIGR03086 family)